MAEGGQRSPPRDRRDYYDPRDVDDYPPPSRGSGDRHGGRGYMNDDRRGRGGRGYMHDDRRGRGGGRGYMNNDYRRGGGRGGGRGPPQRRADDRFRLFRTAASQLDWKGASVEYSQEEASNNNNNQRPSSGEDKDIRHCLRLLWSASPDPPTADKQASKKKSKKEESDSEEETEELGVSNDQYF